MLFKPENTKLWDTFILPHEGTFYLFYLQLRETPWDSYGLAVSKDLIHWEDRGTILATDPGESGMGTGMVWRVKDRWILNYSLGCSSSPPIPGQRIFFAESADLLTWRKLPKDIMCAPDPRWYECVSNQTSGSARWASIWEVPQANGTFAGFLTATARNAPAGANGVAGLVSSKDGIHWQAEPPVSEPCGMAWAEVGCHAQFGARHYLLVGSNSGLGPRFDPEHTSSGKAGGMYVMMAEKFRGPYRLVPGDPLLLGCRNAPPNWAYIPTYFARVFQFKGETLLCHHWMPRSNFLDAWLGTVKVLKEKAPGRLILTFWEGNHALKGTPAFDLRSAPAPHTPAPQSLPNAKWNFRAGQLHGETGGSALAYWETADLFGNGVVIETKVRIDGAGAGGLFLGTREHGPAKPYDGVGLLANRAGYYEMGRIVRAPCGPTFMIENHVSRAIPNGVTLSWRILVRGEFAEWYVDNELIQCFGFSARPIHNAGVFVERSTVVMESLRINRFT